MKKLLILIVIALLTILTLITIVKGIEIGPLEILGIQGMKEKDQNLNEKITEATKLASTDYQKALSELETSSKELETEKQKYLDMTTVSTDSQIQQASQLTKYELEKLYIQVDEHAKAEGVNVTMEITSSNSISNAYNLKFTASGSYIGVTDFIADIEDDTTLGFKIENFSMQAGSQNVVEAKFECTDIMINGISETESTEQSEEQENTTSENTTNSTTNTTSSNSTSNSTNSTNTTNSTSSAD